MPVDQPIQIAPGVTHREADFFAQPSLDRGFYVGFDGYNTTGAAAGNLSPFTRPVPRPLTSDVGPFKNLRGGR